MGQLPGYIAVGGLSWADGYCEGQPHSADNQGNGRPSQLTPHQVRLLRHRYLADILIIKFNLACSKTFVESSGFILSPHYPGFYAPNSHCNWLITAPVGNVIRLEVLDFQLEDGPRCATDHMQVTDGHNLGDLSLGKFCGEKIPAVIESSGNTVRISFRSDKDIQRTGFKLHYYFRGEFKLAKRPRACKTTSFCKKIRLHISHVTTMA